jgi:hypothetical protein
MLAARFAISASGNTILRQLKRRAANRDTPAVRVVGIDDWSWRKGWTYGTIIVDLERHDVVEVIAERDGNTGCINGGQLLHEIKRLGYTGCYSHLQRFLAGWRRAKRGHPASPEPLGEEGRAINPATGWQISPIVAAFLCMKPQVMLTAAQTAKVLALKQSSPGFTAVRRLAMRFRGILRSGKLDKLDRWLHEAHRCGLQAIQRFARTVSHDLAAVRNASTERSSNGPVEGQINRLKTLKRAMYGRAGLELLRARLIPFSWRNSTASDEDPTSVQRDADREYIVN